MGRDKGSVYRYIDARFLWGLWIHCGYPYLASGQGNSQETGLGTQGRG